MSKTATQGKVTTPEGAPKGSRAVELEGYRGIASALVVLFHVFQYVLPDMAEGIPVVHQLVVFEVVDIMFLMSAYLLMLSYARSIIDGKAMQGAKMFLFKRAVRIVPLYWSAVLLVWCIRNPDPPGDWLDLVEHMTFTQVFDSERILYTLGQGWSMSLEVLFYIFLVLAAPVMAFLVGRLRTRRARTAGLLALILPIVAGPAAWNVWASQVAEIPLDHWTVYFGPQARFGAFGWGMLLAVVVAALGDRRPLTGPWPLVTRLAAFGVLAGGTYLADDSVAWQASYHDILAFGWTLFVASTVLAGKRDRWARAMSWRGLTWLGMVSYSTYIWHEPMMLFQEHLGLISRDPADVWWTAPLVVVSAVGCGWVSYKLIETPTGKLRKLFAKDGTPTDYYPGYVPRDEIAQSVGRTSQTGSFSVARTG